MNTKLSERLLAVAGMNVELEGTFPILRQEVVYAPARGRLTGVYHGVYAGWFVGVLESGDQEPTLYALSSARSLRATGGERDPGAAVRLLDDFIVDLVGRSVVIEGAFPIPLPNGQVAYSPASGKLVDHYNDATGWYIDVEEQNKRGRSLFSLSNVRSVHAVESRIARPPPGLVLS